MMLLFGCSSPAHRHGVEPNAAYSSPIRGRGDKKGVVFMEIRRVPAGILYTIRLIQGRKWILVVDAFTVIFVTLRLWKEFHFYILEDLD